MNSIARKLVVMALIVSISFVQACPAGASTKKDYKHRAIGEYGYKGWFPLRQTSG